MFCPEKVKDRQALWASYGKMGGCAFLLNVNPGDAAKSILGDKVSSGDMFLYLYRRFGPPSSHGDTFKSAGDYYLTTPMQGVYLRISATGNDWTEGFFGFLAKGEIWERLREEEYKDEAPTADGVQAALVETIQGLLAYTNVRDSFFNPISMKHTLSEDDPCADYYDFDNPTL